MTDDELEALEDWIDESRAEMGEPITPEDLESKTPGFREWQRTIHWPAHPEERQAYENLLLEMEPLCREKLTLYREFKLRFEKAMAMKAGQS